ncbi:MAG: hypothetical protein WA624_17195, partial [Methylocella sp.]
CPMSRQEINDTRLAHSRLSGECQLVSQATDWLKIRYALTKWGAPSILIYDDIGIPADTRIA